jgi:diguanylate cyclase (GGDEF)-like protein/PAS domain S-box-containing protein
VSSTNLEEILALQRSAIGTLLRSDAIARGDLQRALAEITEAAARVMGVRRASVWHVDSTRTRIDCLDLFDAAEKTHVRGAQIHAGDAPRYFEAALTVRCIVADDARTDPRTSEFTTGYLEPHGITSMLDAPILVRGELVGVICHEHVGPGRAWQPWEELAAGTLADVVGMAMTAAEHAEQSRELQALRGNLENLVEERTRELLESRENVRTLFATSPVALVLTKLGDQSVLMANERAAKLFEVDAELAKGTPATDFWVNPEDRLTMIQQLREHGVLEGLDAELKASSGRRFWGNVSATTLIFEGERTLLVGVHDVTAKRLAEETLRQSEEALRTMLEAAPIPLVVTGLDDSILRFSNKRAADMFGTTVDELVGKRAPDFYENPDDRQTFISSLLGSGRVDDFAARLRARDGRSFWALLSARTMVLRNVRVFMVGFSDLTAQKEIEHRLRDLASMDGLTGAFNRRHFYEAASAAIELGERRGRGSCIAILDVDHFKKVNDAYGHAAGDEALKMLTRVCQRECRSSDVLARYGGEEFVVLLPDTNLESARAVLERIRRALASETVEAPSGTFAITVSGGLAERREGESLEALLARADEALYRAKRGGRDRVIAA